MSPTTGQIPTYYSPVRHSSAPRSPRRDPSGLLPFDLHVLSMPPAFNLSQDQTLQLISKILSPERFFSRARKRSRVDAHAPLFRCERPHKLLELIVKERPGTIPGQTDKYTRDQVPLQAKWGSKGLLNRESADPEARHYTRHGLACNKNFALSWDRTLAAVHDGHSGRNVTLANRRLPT